MKPKHLAKHCLDQSDNEHLSCTREANVPDLDVLLLPTLILKVYIITYVSAAERYIR